MTVAVRYGGTPRPIRSLWGEVGFEELTEGIQADIVANMFRVQVTPQEPPPQPQPVYNGGGPKADAKESEGGEPVGVGAPNRKLGRNDLCWCGSGRKYKRCHGR